MTGKSLEPGIVIEADIDGRPIYFFVVNTVDSIQSAHLSGQFYEMEELQLIGRYFQAGQVFLDVGSNVGNHAIFVEKFLQPKSIILIEPNPQAISILHQNLLLNRMAKTETRYLGFGLSDCEQRVVIEVPGNNLGGARLVARADGAFRVVPGDSLFQNSRIDFIKIDVEGLELQVLRGLGATVAANRPRIFVEVQDGNGEGFLAWSQAHCYRVAERFRRYGVNENYLIVPD
jgi:FkbM family methyltransferase